jgi:L-alanine-DL-glutamate epimerase-like enolase superfamily enzyme
MSAPKYSITRLRLYFIEVQTRVPLKFGPETLRSVTCARVCLQLSGEHGQTVEGWGETPLSVQWVWPSSSSYEYRHERLKAFCRNLAKTWIGCDTESELAHPIRTGFEFHERILPGLLREFNGVQSPVAQPQGVAVGQEQMPWLAAIVCNSLYDLALHDAFAKLVGRPVYAIYGGDLMDDDLASFIVGEPGYENAFVGRFPSEYLVSPPARLIAWHLVGGLDALESGDLSGSEPRDGHPVLLEDWIRRDGLRCLKVKLRGNDSEWDYQRLTKVGTIAERHGVEWLSADFNCTVHDPAYVNEVLDRLRREHASIYQQVLYVEQPFPYDLEAHAIDVHEVAARKPLFLDESAHDWKMLRLGRKLGWTGVALKTCKTQTGAILAACWAKAHGMHLMVQDLTNPMLAQISHVQLAAHVGTIMGVETNAMQFYPAASAPEQKVHPGLYRRTHGQVDLSTIHGPGFGYRLEEIDRELPTADTVF